MKYLRNSLVYTIIVFSSLTSYSQVSFSNGWNKIKVNYDEKGRRHGYFEACDSVEFIYGFGFNPIYNDNSTGDFTLFDLYVNGPAFKSKQFYIYDTIIAILQGDKRFELKKLTTWDTKKILTQSACESTFIIKNKDKIAEVTLKPDRYREILTTETTYKGLTITGEYLHGKMVGSWKIYDSEKELIATLRYHKNKVVDCTGNCDGLEFIEDLNIPYGEFN